MANAQQPGEGNGQSATSDGEDRSLRSTFDRAAARYHRARPRYPDDLYRSLLDVTGLKPGDRVVEIGPATGVASEQLADLGLALTCVELGSQLAAEARHNLARFPDVEVVNESFETWAASGHGDNGFEDNGFEDNGFDAVVAATAWHWLDPASSYRLARRVLRPGGWLTFWSAQHLFPEGGDTIFETLQPVYDRLGLGGSDDLVWPKPGELPLVALPSDAPFEMSEVRQFDWSIEYDADQYIDLLMTFSGHIAMSKAAQAELFAEIRRLLAQRPDGLLRRHWGAVLHMARAL